MMSRSTTATNTSTENLADQIQTLEAEIDQLQQQWKPYRNVQLMRPGQQTGMGPYDPTLFLEKSELSLAIDRKQIELAQLKRQQAEQALAAYDAAGDLSSTEVAHQEAETAYQDGKRAWEATQMAYANARDQLQRQQERHARLTRTVAQFEAAEQRWAKELQRDQQLQEYASGGGTARSIGKVA